MENYVNAVKVMAIDEIANAKSGHPGMAISASRIVCALYKNILNVSPNEPKFINRDRVVFSAGHCSALIYSILHFCGYNVSIDDLKNFRKYGSKTAGHPEFNVCEGVDASTGPLGQGVAMAVGMAMAERHMAEIFNKPNYNVMDHYTYVVCGEGCLMEGVSYEACSLAGLHKLNKLIIIYDCNQITMDGQSSIALNENLCKRFESQGFNCIKIKENASVEEISFAIASAKKSDKPSFIIVPSIIGEGTKVQGTNKAHGTPLTIDEAVEYRQSLGFSNMLFDVPKNVYNDFKEVKTRGEKLVKDYSKMLNNYRKEYALEYEKLKKYLNNDFSFNIKLKENELISGRDLGAMALNQVGDTVDNLFGGTADLMISTKAYLNNGGDFSCKNYSGKNIHFGVREFAMSAISCGIALHGGLIPFCSTFLSFSDYMKSSIRLCALMKLKVIYIFTHDSIEVGEDGPTHQPIEQIDALRSIPNLQVFRSSCAGEVKYAYEQALKSDLPTVIILSKNKLPIIKTNAKNMGNGAYIVTKCEKPLVNIIATGLEVGLGLELVETLKKKRIGANLISIVNDVKFAKLSNKKKNEIVLPNILNVVIETSTAYTLSRLFTDDCLVFNIDRFGASGDKNTLYKVFGFDKDKIAKKIMARIKK